MVTDYHSAPFHGIADPTRRRILELLAVASRPVREIAARFPVSRPAISKHLRLLRESGLVTETRQGRERIYELVPGALESVAAWVRDLGGRTTGADARLRPEPAKPRPRAAAMRGDAALRREKKRSVERPERPAKESGVDWRVW